MEVRGLGFNQGFFGAGTLEVRVEGQVECRVEELRVSGFGC